MKIIDIFVNHIDGGKVRNIGKVIPPMGATLESCEELWDYWKFQYPGQEDVNFIYWLIKERGYRAVPTESDRLFIDCPMEQPLAV